jgi:hypothetical protein
MDYIEWVEKAMGAVVAVWEASDDMARTYSPIDWHVVCHALNLDHTDNTGKTTEAARAVLDALYDLDRIGLIAKQQHGGFRLTQRGKQVWAEGMSTLYPNMIDAYLDDVQIEVLTSLVEISQQDKGNYVVLKGQLLTDIATHLGPNWIDGGRGYRVDATLKQVEGLGMAVRGGAIGRGDAKPTYAGAVRVTRRVYTAMQALIRQLLAEGEAVNVDFKQQIDLRSKLGKAEFVKDILGLINTKFVGNRYMVIGFDDNEPHLFVHSVEQSITKDQMEDILHEYAEPVPSIKYTSVRWESGIAGIIEPIREPHKVPYRTKRTIANKMAEGDIFVRHGSHTFRAAGAELADLTSEGERARQGP